jgi:hypothetical protein
MSTLSLRLPESVHRHLKVVAEREGVADPYADSLFTARAPCSRGS